MTAPAPPPHCASTVEEAIETMVRDTVEEFRRINFLPHKERITLMRGILAFLHRSGNVLERSIQCLTVHAATQAIIDLAESSETIQLSVEPFEGKNVRIYLN